VKAQPAIWIVLGVFAFLFIATLLSILVAVYANDGLGVGNVAVIPIKGIIMTESDSSLLSLGAVSSSDIVDMIEKADKNPRIRAIVLEINSPGGSAVASDEVGQAVKRVNKTTVAWIREVGASGGYWIASACDTVVANRMSITGSIGVISSYLDFSGLITDYNITYQRLVSGKYKDMGSPWKELTAEERDILQEQLDQVHEFFVLEVSQNRGLSMQEARELSTGSIYIGHQAMQNGLVDRLGGEREVQAYIHETEGIKPNMVYFSREQTLFDALTASAAKILGRGTLAPGIFAQYSILLL
jgi:protease-4